jgi:hypothetical protein
LELLINPFIYLYCAINGDFIARITCPVFRKVQYLLFELGAGASNLADIRRNKIVREVFRFEVPIVIVVQQESNQVSRMNSE